MRQKKRKEKKSCEPCRLVRGAGEGGREDWALSGAERTKNNTYLRYNNNNKTLFFDSGNYVWYMCYVCT